MMNLLLDTHIFIWWEIEIHKLSAKRLQLLEDENNTLFLSLASLWELQLKIMPGKFKFPKSLSEIIQDQRRINDLRILPITAEHIYELEKLPFHHKDPFDRLLIAQAIVEDYTLVTDDPQLSAYSAKLI
ncbi:MAG: type II toxin-antitoxin system VapC family toxin [Pyrinomonadaceae bacterium]|nr:type II toxin-antitoxin system VapC family toxin [Pyrinomonadaceae bacterium]